MPGGVLTMALGAVRFSIGGGKSSGYRTLLSAQLDSRYIFLHGFSKSAKKNIAQPEKKALQYAGQIFFGPLREALNFN